MKIKNHLCNILLLALILMAFACSKEEESENENNTGSDQNIDLVGEDGNPRFNLQFSNEENVDLDLYVTTPDGSIIYYGNTFADGGELDVDCLCNECPQGPNENIFWEDGTASEGVYEYWVNYYGSCDGSSHSSDFTVRVTINGEIVETHSGTLSSGDSSVWMHEQI